MNPDQQNSPVAPTPSPAPPSSSYTPQPAMAPMPVAPGKKMNKNIIIGAIVAALLLAAGVAWGVYAFIVNSPDNLMKAAVQNLANEKSLAANLKIESQGSSVSGDIAFKVDQSNDKNAEVILGLGAGDERFGLSALALDKTVYLKLTSAEKLGAMLGDLGGSPEAAALAVPQFATMLENISGQWFELTENDLKSLAGSTGATSAASATTASPEDIRRVVGIYDQHSFIKADKTFADESVGGVVCAHFSVKFDKNTYISFLRAVKDANLASVKVTDADIQNAQDQPDPNADVAIELWIARDTKKFKQIRAENTKPGEQTKVTLTVANTLPTFDEFEKPAGAKSISELMTMLLGPAPSQLDFEEL